MLFQSSIQIRCIPNIPATSLIFNNIHVKHIKGSNPACFFKKTGGAKLQPAGEEHAKSAIAVARRPPVAAHALRVEMAEEHEEAVSGARIRPGIDIGQ